MRNDDRATLLLRRLAWPVSAFLQIGQLAPLFDGAATFAEINGLFV